MTEVDHTFWYLTRASGLLAYLLLFASVALGLTLTGGQFERQLGRFRVYDLHRFVALLALAVTVFHMLIVLPDRYFSFSLLQLLLPFASPYEPLYMALGGFSLYLTALVIGSFYVRRFLSYSVWRLLHYLMFGAFALALAHGIGAGTDTAADWVLYLYVATALVATNLLIYRALKGSARGLRAAEES